MLRPEELFNQLATNGIDFYVGVPDSLLKEFCAFISDKTDAKNHIISANEGNALAIAAGYYLANQKPACVYLQNSGLGNIINPLLSLNDNDVYGLPALLLIGWRGEPGINDEPQHMKQGALTPSLLDLMGIPWEIVDRDTLDLDRIVARSMHSLNQCKTTAILVKKNTFEKYEVTDVESSPYVLKREEAISQVARHMKNDDIGIAATGMISRELYEFRLSSDHSLGRDFLTVGSMGHCSSIALSVSRKFTSKRVFCFDGDGSILMHMGSLAIIGQSKLKNFYHIVFNNGAHDSVGGQPTCALSINLCAIAKACGYDNVYTAKSIDEIDNILTQEITGSVFLEVFVSKGSRSNLGRPRSSPCKNRNMFIDHLRKIDL